MTTYYIAKGSVRGSCGHKHKTAKAAYECCQSDAKGIAKNYPGSFPTRAYSDRKVIAVEDGQERPLTEAEEYGVYPRDEY